MSRDRKLLIGGGVGALVIVIVLVAVLVFTGGGSKAGASVFKEPLSSSRDPFAPPLGTDQPVPQPVTTPPGYQVPGGHVGLYGGTENQSTCDKNQLITFLQANPDKAAAWAGVIGIQVSQISTYVNSLTPVVLRSDTVVQNHGFANGSATSFTAVLQAGTAVLLDDKGDPVTKCYCGNPLSTPPYYSSPPNYYGRSWTGWSANSYTYVQINTTIITQYTLIDIHSGQEFQRPAGTDGTMDFPGGPGSSPPTTTTTTQPPPVTHQTPRTNPPPTKITQPPPTSGPACDPNDVDTDPTLPEEMAEDAAGCS